MANNNDLPYDALLDRLKQGWPATLYNPRHKQFLFASGDTYDLDPSGSPFFESSANPSKPSPIFESSANPPEPGMIFGRPEPPITVKLVECKKEIDDRGRSYFLPKSVDGGPSNEFAFYSKYYGTYVAMHEKSDLNRFLQHLDKPYGWRIIDVPSNKYGNYVKIADPQRRSCYLARTPSVRNGDNLARVWQDYEENELWQVVFDKPTKVELTAVRFDIDAAALHRLPPLQLTSNLVINEAYDEQTKTSTFNYTTTKSKQWGNSESASAGVTVGMTAGIPYLGGEASIEVSAETTFETTYGETKSETMSFTETVPVLCPPRSSIHVTMMAFSGRMDVPYTATMTTFFEDGLKTTTEIKDKFSGVESFHVETHYGTPFPLDK